MVVDLLFHLRRPQRSRYSHLWHSLTTDTDVHATRSLVSFLYNLSLSLLEDGRFHSLHLFYILLSNSLCKPSTMRTRANTQPTASDSLNIKMLVLGVGSVGKSSLLLRFTDQQWLPEGEMEATIGVDTYVDRKSVV